MRNFRYILILCVVISFVVFSAAFPEKEAAFKIPKGWPQPVYDFEGNPPTEAGFQLGRRLFFDPILSRDSTISCASCHLQATGFTHVDHDLSHGIEGRIGTRNSLVIMNMAWNKHFMWDGGINHLDVQALAPITSESEMDEELENVVNKLSRSIKYRSWFAEAFGDSSISGQKTLKALAQFAIQLNTSNAKYDKYVRGEEGVTFSDQEKNGLAIFRANCASCHQEPLFMSNRFANNGLALDPDLKDYGRMMISRKAEDSLKFKIPTLRNIQFTYPYMHDGRFEKLSEVIDHYVNGVQHGPTLASELQKPIVLSAKEKVDLIAFLHTLTDKEFLFNPRFYFPRD